MLLGCCAKRSRNEYLKQISPSPVTARIMRVQFERKPLMSAGAGALTVYAMPLLSGMRT